MSFKELWWNEWPHLIGNGESFSPDTRETYKVSGWWQALSSLDYRNLSILLNEDRDNLLMTYALFFRPKSPEQALVRIYALENSMRRRRHQVSVVTFSFSRDTQGFFDIVELVDLSNNEKNRLGLTNLVSVVNRPLEIDFSRGLEDLNALIDSTNFRLEIQEQALIPKFPKLGY